MSLSNEDARKRVQALHDDLHARQQDVGALQKKFEKINKETRQIIDDALKKEGVATVADLVQKVTDNIQDAEQRKTVKDVINELNPPNTFTGILWDKIKDPVNDALEIGQFIAMSNFTSSAFALNSASWNLSLAQTRAMGAIVNAYRTRIATQFIGEAVINGAELGLSAVEVAEVEEQAALATEVMGGEGAEFAAGIDTAIEGVAVAEEAFAAAATGCIVAVAIVLVVAGAHWLWNKHKESEEADKLKIAIAELCTARLFVAQTEQISQTFVALSEIAKQITQGIVDKQPVDTLQALYVSTAKDLQLASSTDTRLNELYESLKAQDKNINTAEDPDLPAMKARHQNMIDESAGQGCGQEGA